MPRRRQQRQHARQFVGKTQVEQPVGFVQHQGLHLVQAQGVVLHQVQQAPGCGHDDVGAAAQRHHLWVDRDAAKGQCDFHAPGQGNGKVAQHGRALHRQLARRHQHQGTHRARLRVGRLHEALEQG